MHKWERVQGERGDKMQTTRMHVPGGWLYFHSRFASDADNGWMVFVPDDNADIDAANQALHEATKEDN